MATVGAVVILALIWAALMVLLKSRPSSGVAQILALSFRLAIIVISILIGIAVTKQVFRKQFSDFKVTLVENNLK